MREGEFISGGFVALLTSELYIFRFCAIKVLGRCLAASRLLPRFSQTERGHCAAAICYIAHFRHKTIPRFGTVST